MKENNFSQFLGTIKAKIFGNTEGGIQTSKTAEIILVSTILCPNCGHKKEETMRLRN